VAEADAKAKAVVDAETAAEAVAVEDTPAVKGVDIVAPGGFEWGDTF